MSSIPPTDTGQALTRVFLVALVVFWTLQQSGDVVLDVPLRGPTIIPLAYLAFALVSLAAFLYIDSLQDGGGQLRLGFRVVCLFGDICALAIYTAISHDLAIVLLPIYLTYIIGNGFRFGLRYFAAAMAMSLIGFTIAMRFNSYLNAIHEFLWMYYLSMIFVPLYSASLLLKYQKTLGQLREVTIELDSFINTMSHEFRAPLHTILSLTMASRVDDRNAGATSSDSSDSDNRFRLIELCCDRLLSVVNRVVRDAMSAKDISRRRSESPGNLNTDVKNVADICRVQAQFKGLQFHWFVDSGVPAETDLPSSVVQEILINLIDNAVKYTEAGIVQVSVLRVGEDETSAILIIVEDSGIGIATRSPYQRIKESFRGGATPLISGGLGLTITRSQVARLGGSIEYASPKSGGTQCRVTLPVAETKSKSLPIKPWLIAARASNIPLSSVMLKDYATSGIIVVEINSRQSEGTYDRLDQYDILISDDLDWMTRAVRTMTELEASTLLPLMASTAPPDRWSSARGTPFNVFLDENRSASVERLTTYFGDRRAKLDTYRSRALAGRTMLLIDDSEIVAGLTAQSIRKTGADVDISTTYNDAINKLNRKTYDFVISDQNLDKFDGCGVVEVARAGRNRETLIALLTGDSSSQLKERAINCGADFVLVKPVAPDVLIERVLEAAAPSVEPILEYPSIEASDRALDNIRQIASNYNSEFELENMLETFRIELSKDLTALVRAANEDRIDVARKLLHRTVGLAQTLYVWPVVANLDCITSLWNQGKEIPVSLLRDIGDSYFEAAELYRGQFRAQFAAAHGRHSVPSEGDSPGKIAR